MSQTIRQWRPCTVTTVASCGKGLASIKEGGNLAPEGTRVTAELASCREARQGARRAAESQDGRPVHPGFRVPNSPGWRA